MRVLDSTWAGMGQEACPHREQDTEVVAEEAAAMSQNWAEAVEAEVPIHYVDC